MPSTVRIGIYHHLLMIDVQERWKYFFLEKPGCILLIHIKYYTYILAKTFLNKKKITYWSLQRLPGRLRHQGTEPPLDIGTDAELAA